MDFQPVRIGIEVPEVTFEPSGVANMNLISQAVVSLSDFCLLSLFRLGNDRLDH